jgi:predicted nucleotidyltransferase
MYILDADKFRNKIGTLGFTTDQELAAFLGVHRNTIQGYFSGRAVFKKNFEGMMSALGLDPLDFLTTPATKVKHLDQAIAKFIDQLSAEFSDLTFVLFGSRSRGQHQPYADLDIGVFCATGLVHKTYLTLRKAAARHGDDLPIFFDLVNLNGADQEFLKNISLDLKFLSGKREDWLKLKERCIHGKEIKAS